MSENNGVPVESGVDAAKQAALRADRVRLGYRGRTISDQLSVDVPDGEFTVVIGPNACGKSTLLRALARLLAPESGAVLLDGKSIATYPAKEVARRIGLLPQSSIAPDGIRVADLVARGRYPHQSLLRQWSQADADAVAAAMAATGVAALSARPVAELSGGQRQRVWIAMVLAQDTPVILLDEPTTYLDIAHQIHLLDLCRALHRDSGRTVVAVLHDLNHAFRYAGHLIAMKDGRVVAAGPPKQIVTAELVREVFDLGCRIIDDPETGAPLVIPLAENAARVG
ncbi:ABC transporter ATP-binding protein [Nocardia brasiliensis]|uniref:ABC transporter ATP-binding protein n=1 Tax=Nocardia brasiliensis TaxID=37326 RepID=UPI0024579D75|nr:ABC transporter ATP-binding protein [Nocardia brasiliensis]